MLLFVDKVLLWCIAWLYVKHTRIYLHLEAKKSAVAAPYPPPEPEVVDHALARFGFKRDDLAVRMGTHRNVDTAVTL